MRIQQISSHLNGEEFLLVHKQTIYEHLKETIEATHPDLLQHELKDQGWMQFGESSQQPYWVKERVAIEIRYNKQTAENYNFFVNHLAFYVTDQIDVGIEILPMKSMQAQMSSGVAYYEGELYNIVRQGRAVPAVPLVILGIDA